MSDTDAIAGSLRGPTSREVVSQRAFVVEGARPCRDALRYGAAFAVVVLAVGLIAMRLDRTSPASDANEVEDAVLVDLPEVETPAAQRPDQAEDKVDPAAVTPLAHDDQPPIDQQRTDVPTASTPPVSPVEPAALPPSQDSLAMAVDASDEAGRPKPSARAISAWQRALMRSLEAAKRRLGAILRPAGTVRIAFTVDEHGALKAASVAASSGSEALDRIALHLVERAAPFPNPPLGADAQARSFVVPVRFR